MQPLVDFSTNHPALAGGAALVLLLSLFSLRIANQYERAVVFFLGRYARTSGTGTLFADALPRMGERRSNMRVTTTGVEQQETITPRQCADQDQRRYLAAHRRSGEFDYRGYRFSDR